MWALKDLKNNTYFSKINGLGNIETELSYFKTYNILDNAKKDLAILRKQDYVKGRTWKIVEVHRDRGSELRMSMKMI